VRAGWLHIIIRRGTCRLTKTAVPVAGRATNLSETPGCFKFICQTVNVSRSCTLLDGTLQRNLRNLTIQQFNLTPREIQVATLVKEGRNSGQIADILNISKGAVDFHRNNIRKKLGINKAKVNLRSFLLKLEDNET